jgi:[acyl-carrier-protein] S-malonyltransferase
VAMLALKTPADLDAARATLADHADSHSDSSAPDWRLIVAPAAGTFRPAGHQADQGRQVAVLPAGTVLGHLESRGDTHPVSADFAACIIEWLVEEGDPVSPGQPLVRLAPASEKS